MKRKRDTPRGKFRSVAEVGPDPRRHHLTPEERRRGGLRRALQRCLEGWPEMLFASHCYDPIWWREHVEALMESDQ